LIVALYLKYQGAIDSEANRQDIA